MRKEETRTDLGMIKIHKNVIASIASLAAIEIEGVKRIGGDFASGLLGLLGKESLSAIKVEILKGEEVKLDIPLVIQYGFNVPDIANRVQESVRNALERMTNLSIKEVNVSIQAIEKKQ